MSYKLSKTIIEIQFIDGEKREYTIEEKKGNRNACFAEKEGIEININELEQRDSYGDVQYQEKLLFPYSNIKCVEYSYKYKISERKTKKDILSLLAELCLLTNELGIMLGELEQEILNKGIKLSEEDLKIYLDVLVKDEKIRIRENSSSTYIKFLKY